jgi:hypothetical protein
VTATGWSGGTRAALAAVALLFCAAPTPGDVGGCGQDAQELDSEVFFLSKANIDCERCQDCRLTTGACERACDASAPVPALPEGCVPLVHDGEVCLRALLFAACSDYAGYVADREPRIPTECNFCPPLP